MTFRTTAEARDRFLAIVDKIGGPREKARSRALFGLQFERNAVPTSPLDTNVYPTASVGDHTQPSEVLDIEDQQVAVDEFWKGSRFPRAYIPDLVPVQIHPDHDDPNTKSASRGFISPGAVPNSVDSQDTFRSRLQATCLDLLSSSPPVSSLSLSNHHHGTRSSSSRSSKPRKQFKAPPSSKKLKNQASEIRASPNWEPASALVPSSIPNIALEIPTFIPAQTLKIGPSVRSGITPHTLRSLLQGVSDTSFNRLQLVIPSSISSSSTAASGGGGESETRNVSDPQELSRNWDDDTAITGSQLEGRYENVSTEMNMMTTLTANRSSIQTILRRMNVLYPLPLPSLSPPSSSLTSEEGVIWIVEPRSLAEGMRADL